MRKYQPPIECLVPEFENDMYRERGNETEPEISRDIETLVPELENDIYIYIYTEREREDSGDPEL